MTIRKDMAYIDRNISEYPYRGRFYYTSVDMSLPMDQRVPEEVTVLDTECDMQEAGSNVTGGITNASFSIYFPFDAEGTMPVRRGHMFRGEMYGMVVDGEVIGVFPTQLGGCVAYLKDRDVNGSNG